MDSVEHEQIRSVGFNTRIVHGERTFDVQTEVMGRSAMTVRTTVIEGGVVRLLDSQPFAANAGDLGSARERVAQCHELVVRRVRRGEIE